LFSHQQSLRKSLAEEQDPAMALHIILVLLFQQEIGAMIHIPGKFIPTMVSFLGQHLPKKEHENLVECQRLITAKWKARQPSEPEAEAGEEDESGETDEGDAIEALIQELKRLVVQVKSLSQT
jgi:hypothetical protein